MYHLCRISIWYAKTTHSPNLLAKSTAYLFLGWIMLPPVSYPFPRIYRCYHLITTTIYIYHPLKLITIDTFKRPPSKPVFSKISTRAFGSSSCIKYATDAKERNNQLIINYWYIIIMYQVDTIKKFQICIFKKLPPPIPPPIIPDIDKWQKVNSPRKLKNSGWFGILYSKKKTHQSLALSSLQMWVPDRLQITKYKSTKFWTSFRN